MNATVTDDGPSALTERIAGGPAAAARARELLTDTLGESLPDDRLHDALLLTTELVTNAVRHADVSEARSLELTVASEARRVRVAVTDPGGTSVPRMQEVDLMSPGGMGLFLVDQLSSRWGTERGSGGATQVWFELQR